MIIDNAYRLLFLGALIWFSLLILIMLIRAVIGPGISDRILSINMIGSMVISCVCILSYVLSEDYLLDIALLYAMISFASVLILCATYIPNKPSRRKFFHTAANRHTPGGRGKNKDSRADCAAEDAAGAVSGAGTEARGDRESYGPKGRKGGEQKWS